MYNTNSLDSVCGALAYAMGITPPEQAAPKNTELAAYIDEIDGDCDSHGLDMEEDLNIVHLYKGLPREGD